MSITKTVNKCLLLIKQFKSEQEHANSILRRIKKYLFLFLFWRTQISLRLGISEQTKKTELNSVHGKRVRNGIFEMAEPYLGSKYFFLQI